MSITFGHNGPTRDVIGREPCTCVSRAHHPVLGSVTVVRSDCHDCRGVGTVSTYELQPGAFNVSIGNAAAICKLLGIDFDPHHCGEIPLTKARQCHWVARARFSRVAPELVRPVHIEHAEPRQRGNLHELRGPVKFARGALTIEMLERYLQDWQRLLAAAEADGATSIIWG